MSSRDVDCLSSFITCFFCFGTMKPSPQGESIQIMSSSGAFESERHDVFSTEIYLPLPDGNQCQ